MEMGSSSSSSSDSINGLKFGQKIYFEDVGVGVQAKSGGGSSSSGATAGQPPKKGRSGAVQPGQPPRCQVEGCKVDLSDAKAYYSRHKVCGMHSKSPKVIVAGLEQRFCQQCSRFHQLPEFDQGKRSCRRRLAGHNERRRKPPPGSLLSSRYGRLPSVFETGRGGGILMDFSAYPKFTGRDPWPIAREYNQVSTHQPTDTGRFLPHPWQTEAGTGNPPSSDLFLQSSPSETKYTTSTIPSGECFAGVSDSGCALSLLSNQTWGSRDRSTNLGATNFLNSDAAPIVHSAAATHNAAMNHFSTASWGFKGNEVGSSSNEMLPNLGIHQIPESANNQYSGELELAQQSRRQYIELEHSPAYDSPPTQHMQWSL